MEIGHEKKRRSAKKKGNRELENALNDEFTSPKQ
jgi:hypothetical protein